mmetsp:Transcript_58217/g.188446  ORF Transcript_58217/g.188446 Transcript_58217/m.188446 type:complete len:337 (+) Transcript_58217:1252-2262(+)
MAQFTPAPNNLHPMNFPERAFAVCVLFVGLVLFSSLLGSTTALLNMSRKEAFDRMKTNDSLRRYLSENQVSLRLSNQVLRFLRPHKIKHVRVHEADVPALKALPMSLQVELRYEVYASHFNNPVFEWLKISQEDVVVEICSTAVSECTYKKGEEPFNCREHAKCVYFVLSGSMSYYPGKAFLLDRCTDDSSQERPVKPGAWLSEAVLWMHWGHKGLLAATAASVVVKINADAVRMAVQRQQPALQSLRGYVQQYAQRMQQAVAAREEVDDTWVAFRTLEELMEALPQWLRIPRHDDGSYGGEAGSGVLSSPIIRFMHNIRGSGESRELSHVAAPAR